MASLCNCSVNFALQDDVGEDLAILGCSAAQGTLQHQCLVSALRLSTNSISVSSIDFPVTECPFQCEGVRVANVQRVARSISDGQVEFIKQTLRSDPKRIAFDVSNLTADSVAVISVGISAIAVLDFVESPAVTLGALFGSLGGKKSCLLARRFC